MDSPYPIDVHRHPSEIIKVVLRDEEGTPIGRASLVLIVTEINVRPYGLFEHLFVAEQQRSSGLGSRLVQKMWSSRSRKAATS